MSACGATPEAANWGAAKEIFSTNMPRTVPITPSFSIAPAPAAEDFATLSAQGFRTVIGFVPDGETTAGPSSREMAQFAASNGLRFVHIPVAKYDVMSGDVVSAARSALAAVEGPVLGTCVSGHRAAMVWAAAMTDSLPVDQILETLLAAGMNFSVLRDDLETHAQLARLQDQGLPTAA